jgi:SAM-dependent methyltransferase
MSHTDASRFRESWNTRFDRPDYLFGTEPNDFLAAVAGNIPPGDVLCLAEGEGRNAVFLAGLGYRVTAVDQSAVGLAKAQRLATERGVEITTIVGDLQDFEIAADSWSAIVSIFLHVPTNLRAAVYARSERGLKSGGVFILEAYTPRQIGLGTGGPRDPDLTPTLALLRDELAGLQLEIGAEHRRDVLEGSGHTGPGEVVQVLARKP